jgi:TP901 family phage tail tape measure protein
MATTIYKFQSDLQGLKKLNEGLIEAKKNLDSLKQGTKEYASASKNVGGMTNSLGENNTALKKTKKSADQLNSSGRNLMTTFKGASIAIISAFAFRAIMSGMRGLITIFAKFEDRMAAVRAISGATDKEFEALVESAKELGETTVFTANEVAQLQEELSRLGFETEQIVAMQGAILNLAAATGENLSKAAEVAGSQLNSFGLVAENTTRVTDVMGFSFANSALNLERFTQSMKFVAPVAKTAGFTIEETSAMLMVLADNGIHGSIAGNALKNIFLRLGDANSTLNKSIGHTVQGLPQLITEMKKMEDASFGLTEATELLDKRSAPAFLVLLRNIEELDLNRDKLNKVEGDITRMANVRLDTLQGDFTLLKSATEGLGLAVGESLNFEFRKLIFTFTQWVKSIASSEDAINNIKGVIFAVITAIKFFMIRLAALKVLQIATTLSTFSLSRAWKAYTVSIRAATAGTRGFTFALKGLRAAIASTGIGLLIVGLGALVGWLMSSSDEADEATFAHERLRSSFNEEMNAVKELNETSTERHDRLREMVATYGDLIGMIDLEIASNEELDKIQKAVNKSAGLMSQVEAIKANIQAKKDENAVTQKGLLDEIDLIKEKKMTIAKSVSSPHKDSMTVTIHEGKTTEELVKEKEKTADALQKLHDMEMIRLDLNLKAKEKVLAKELEAELKQQGLLMENGESYRMFLRDENINLLEDFRGMSHEKQKIRKEEADAELFSIQEAIRLMDMQSEIERLQLSGRGDVAQKYTETLNRTLANASVQTQSYFNEFKNEHGKINVVLSEFQTYVSNLSVILKKSGKSYRKSALSGFRLQRTKDRIKELTKIQINQINDNFKREIAANEASFNNQTEKYEKERRLIQTNQRSIQKIIDKNVNKSASKRHKQWVADIKANKNNYDVLKNMDIDEWDKLMDVKQNNNDDYLKILDAMMKEEQEKEKTNGQIILELKEEFENEKLKLEIENRATIGELQREEARLDADLGETDISNLISNQETIRKLMEDDHAEQLRADQELLDLGEMSQIEFNNRKKARDLEMKELEKKQYEERLEAFSEMYSAMADVVMAVSARISQANMDRIQTEHEQRTEDLNNQFERDLELAEQSGADTEAMKEEHDSKMETLERQKEEKLRVIKRRQFMLDKANNIAMAIINGAQAIAKVTSQTGIGAIVAAPVTSGLIAAQIGTIMAQRFQGAKGGLIPEADDKFADGGMVVGPSHANGGVKFASGGRVVELEGGEAVINKRSTAMFHGQLSAMNQAGGGKAFAQGGVTPGTRAALDSSKGNWNASDIAELISSSINSQQVYVSESEISSTQSNVGVTESLATLFK